MARRTAKGSQKPARVADKAISIRHGKQISGAAIGPAPDQNLLEGREEPVESIEDANIRHVYDLTTGRRRVVVLPADMCRRLGISEGTPLRVVEHEGRFEVIPMRLVPATEDHTQALADLLAGVTALCLHRETGTGPAVGQESW
jgi:antitoxin component of MazEF toxin-antitoxin module